MEILIGAMGATIVFLVIDKFRKPKAHNEPGTHAEPETEEAKLKREERERHLEATMNYDYTKAVKHG